MNKDEQIDRDWAFRKIGQNEANAENAWFPMLLLFIIGIMVVPFCFGMLLLVHFFQKLM